jgi:catechol 2,3-dioxygenase-like lactoylglutathione lyase family enzyme
MSDNPMPSETAPEISQSEPIEMKLELVVIPVSDVDRAKRFYSDLGWRLDLDFVAGDDYRVVQFTPPTSASSLMFGENISVATPGTAKGLHLVVKDIKVARNDLVRRGIQISEAFHDLGGVFHHADGQGIARGPNPQRKSYASYASFNYPDGNGWLLQEITARLPGKPGDTSFTSQLAKAVWGASP